MLSMSLPVAKRCGPALQRMPHFGGAHAGGGPEGAKFFEGKQFIAILGPSTFCGFFSFFSISYTINGHFRNLNWRYLPYIRPW